LSRQSSIQEKGCEMNQTEVENSLPDSSAIHAALAAEEELIPSSGFLVSVMDRVQEESHRPAPIPFPWKRAIPGIILSGGVFGWGTVELVQQAMPAMRAFTIGQLQIAMPASRPLEAAGWVALAGAVSLVSWILSRRLAGESSLL
jgi:hypothetical protein